VISTISYLKLRKIRKLIDENQSELEKTTDESEQMILLQTHQLLKKMEIELTAVAGTVIIK
jgi:DNA primase